MCTRIKTNSVNSPIHVIKEIDLLYSAMEPNYKVSSIFMEWYEIDEKENRFGLRTTLDELTQQIHNFALEQGK